MNRNLFSVSVPAVSALVLAVGLVACGDDNPTAPGGGGIGGSTESTAKSVVSDIVLPLTKYVYLQTYVGSLGAAPLPGIDACQPLNICATGSAEFCPVPGGAQVNFTSCKIGTSVIGGTVSIQGTTTAGNAGISVTLNGIPLEGTIDYSATGECFNQTYQLSGQGEGFTLSLRGALEYCNPATVNGVVVPTAGLLAFTFPEQGWIVSVLFPNQGAAGDVTISVTDLAYTHQLLACNGNLFTGISCFAP